MTLARDQASFHDEHKEAEINAGRKGKTAINWLLAADPCIIPIPGAENARQAAENAGALGWRLTEQEHRRISQAEMAAR